MPEGMKPLRYGTENPLPLEKPTRRYLKTPKLPSGKMVFWQTARVDLIIIVTILIAGLKFTFGIENTLDIGLYDESQYLDRGVTLWNSGLPSSANAPLYAIWYFILSLLEPNRVNLYYLNYKLTIIALPILIYYLLRRNTVSILVSLIISWLVLVSPANAVTWPKVSHFGLLLILATILVIGHKGPLLRSSVFASIGALLVSYVRPEYFLTYILSTVLFIFLFIRDYKELERQYSLGLMACGLLLSVLLIGTLGFPITGNRSMLAFGQHFSLNWVYWNRSAINPWTNWGEIISHNFGSVHSLPEAFAQNPSAFLKHVTYNILNFLRFTPKLFFPVNLKEISASVVALLSIGLLVANLVIAYLSNTHYARLLTFISNVRKNILQYQRLLILVGLFLVPGLVSIIIIYPRDHYLLVFSVLMVAIIAILSTSPDFKQGQVNFKKLFFFCAVTLIATPGVPQGQNFAPKPNVNTIQFIQSMEISEQVNLLEAQGGYNIYLGSNFHRVKEYDKNANFDHFRADRNINMVVVSDLLLKDARFANDPEWQSFLENYHQSGYLQIEIPNTPRRKILVRADLLHK